MTYTSTVPRVKQAKQITLRFPEVGYERLLRLCERYGVTIRGLFEAATLVSLEDEADPARRDGQLAIWDVARCLEASDAFRVAPRHKIVVTMDKDIFERLKAACRRFGVSQNAALALVVMPWPTESPPECVEHRRQNISRIVDQARRLDFGRRGGRLTPA